MIILEIPGRLKTPPEKTCKEEFSMVASSSLVGSVTKECCHKDSVNKKTLLQRGFQNKEENTVVLCVVGRYKKCSHLYVCSVSCS